MEQLKFKVSIILPDPRQLESFCPIFLLFSPACRPLILMHKFPVPLLRSGNSILHTAADSVTSAVQKASQALNERGERLGRAEDKTADMMNSSEQFAVTAHKVRPWRWGEVRATDVTGGTCNMYNPGCSPHCVGT